MLVLTGFFFAPLPSHPTPKIRTNEKAEAEEGESGERRQEKRHGRRIINYSHLTGKAVEKGRI